MKKDSSDRQAKFETKNENKTAICADVVMQNPPQATPPDAVDYPVVACPNCRDTNTYVLPPENQPERAKAEGWRKRECRACGMKFKEAAR